MDNFNLKQFLVENKLGMYAKVSETEPEIVHQESEEGEDEYNTNGGGTTTVQVQEMDMIILGKEYLINGEVEVEYHREEGGPIDDYHSEPDGYQVDKAKITISELHVEDGDSYRQITDPKFIKQIQDLINTDPKLNAELEEYCQNSAIDWFNIDEQIGVGYVNRVKDSDPDDREF